jgi:DNA-binding SARP family transcriptional activator
MNSNAAQPSTRGVVSQWKLSERLLELIVTGDYDQAAEMLKELRDPGRENDLVLSELCSAIQELCRTCNHLHSKANYHQHEFEAAKLEEDELRNQLFGLLAPSDEMLNPPSSPPAQTNVSPAHRLLSESSYSTRVWERIQSILKFTSEPRRPVFSKPESGASDLPIAHDMGEVRNRPPLEITATCFGPFRILCNDLLVSPWTSHKSLAIFKYLIRHHPTPISKDVLIDVFWPETDPETARPNLHQAIYSLRQTLRRACIGSKPIRFENDCYSIDPAITIRIDFLEFDACCKAGRQLESAGRLEEAILQYRSAESMYLGDFLEEDLYDDWAAAPREQYRMAYLTLAERLIEYYQQQGAYQASIEMCQKVLARDHCHEKAHFRLMQCYHSLGRRSWAARQYHACVKSLKDELGVLPSDETTTLFKEITDGKTFIQHSS